MDVVAIAYEQITLTTLVQVVLVGLISYMLYRRSRKPKHHHYTEEEKERLIANWKPEPLAKPVDLNHPALNVKYVQGKIGHMLRIDDKDYLNSATFDFLGLVDDQRIAERAKETIGKYGVGSCGPRAFYGTFDVHIELEEQIATFMDMEEAVLYSYGFATMTSAIPAFSKRGDIIYADECSNFALQKGMEVSRSTVKWFKHNDYDHLERLMQEQEVWDVQNPKKAKNIRRFMVVEGIYVNTGQLLDLPRIIALKWKYKTRIFLDESFTFGVLGANGKGLTDFYQEVDPIDVDMIMVSMENAISSTGGFCVGRSFVIDHHRLAGTGYCFSASLPPLLATAATQSLIIMQEEPQRFVRLHKNTKRMFDELTEVVDGKRDWSLDGCEQSPLLHLRYESDSKTEVERALDHVVDFAFAKGIAFTRARYLEEQEKFPPRQSVRVTVNSEMSDAEVDFIVATVKEAVHRFK